MKPPILKPGQYSGALAQARTGVLLDKKGKIAISDAECFWIFDDLHAAEEDGRSKVATLPQLEFVIWDHQGAHVEFLRSSIAAPFPREKEKSWWRLW